jgi:RHS repeat-associated protein
MSRAPSYTFVLSLALLLGSFAVPNSVSAFGAGQWEWKAQGVSGTFNSKEAALAALKARGGDYAYLDKEEGVSSGDAQWTYYKYSVEPKAPVADAWVYWSGIYSFPTEEEAYEFAYQNIYETYGSPQCPNILEPAGDWTSTGSLMDLSAYEQREYEDDRLLYDEANSTCIQYGDSNSYVMYRQRNVHCDDPAFHWLASAHKCVITTTGTIQGHPLVCGPHTANPCDVSTGSKTQVETDYSGPTLSFTREYHSLLPASSHLSTGWVHNYSSKIIVSSGSAVMLVRPSGFEEPLLSKWGTINGVAQTYWVSSTESGLRVQTSGTNFVVFHKSGAKEIYNSLGTLQELVDPNGLETLLTYDATGKFLEQVTDSFGHTLTFTYDGDKLESITDPADQLISYTYDANNNLTQVTYPDNSSRQYLYEDANFPNALTGLIDENGDRYKTVTYDSIGRALTSELGNGLEKVTLTYYDYSTTVTDARGEPTVYGLTTVTNLYKKLTSLTTDGESRSWVVPGWSQDNLRRPTQLTDERGTVTKYAYDPNHRTSVTEAFGTPQQRITTYGYLEDQSDRLTSVTSPSVYSSGSRQVITTYNASSLPDTITISGYTPSGTAVSRSIGLDYNASGQVTEINGPRTDVSDITTLSYYECSTGNECGQLHTVTNALGHVTSYDSYDANGRVTQVTDPNNVVTTYTYDLRGRPLTVTETPPSGPARVTTYTYDDTGQLESVEAQNGTVLTYGYDSAHYLRSVTDNLGNKIEYGYDLNGNRTDEDIKDPNGVLKKTMDNAYDARNQLDSMNSAGSVTGLIFDAVGNLTDETDPNSNGTGHDYDPLNRLLHTVDALSGTTTLGYDKNDQLTSVAAPNGAATSYVYDDLGNLLSMTSPDTGTTTYTYDGAGNRATQTDANGVTVQYTYDALNRLTDTDYPNSTLDVTLTYDQGTNQKSRLTTMVDGSGTTTFSYDVYGNLTQESKVIDGHAHVTGYSYDAADLLTSITYPSGRTVDYTRNILGQVTEVDSTYDSNTITVANNVTYEPFGPLSGLTFGNNLAMSRTFDQQYRLTDQTTGSAQDVSFTLDAAGNVDAIDDYVNSSLDQTFTQDALNRIDSESGAYGSNSYTYDGVGNRLTRTSGLTTQTLTYVANSNRLATHDGNTVSIDASGNTTADPTENVSFTYDDHNRMVEAYVGAVLQASYVYNGQGERMKKVEATGSQNTTVYHYGLGGQLLGETVYDSSGAKIGERDYIWLNSLPLAQSERTFSGGTVTSSQFIYIHADQLNTPRLATDGSGTVVWRWDSDVFGVGDADEDPDSDMTLVNIRLRFPGQYFDEETGLDYNYHRDYDPALGRYVQPDPIGLDGGLNPYLYAGGNPLRYVDPSGLAKTSVDAAIEQAIIRGDVNQLRFLLENAANLSRAESEALVKQCAENIPDKIGTIASKLGRSPKEVARAIEQVKQRGMPRGGPLRNPDVRVDPRSGDVFPKTPEGSVGDSIGNIFDFL